MPVRGVTRLLVLTRDGWRCQYCGMPAIHVDHVVPKALRRRHHIDDSDPAYLAAACGPCNWRKGTRRRRHHSGDLAD